MRSSDLSNLLFGIRIRAHLGEMSWVVVAQGLGFVGSLGAVKLATNLLGPGDYGRLAAALAIASVVQVCLYGAISQTSARFLFFARAQRMLRSYLHTLALLFGLALTVVFAAWVVASYLDLSEKLEVANWLVVAFIVTSGTQMVLLAILNAARARKAVAMIQMIEAVGRPVLIFVAATFFWHTPGVILGAYITSAIIVSAVALIMLFRSRRSLSILANDVKIEPGLSLTSQMLAYAAPFVVFGIVGALGGHGERLLLTVWMPWEQVGIYALTSQIAVAPTVLLTNLINQFYFPVVFHQDPAGTAEFGVAFKRYLLFSAAGTLILALAVLIAGPYLITLVSTTAFLGHEYLLWPLVVSAGLFAMGQQLALPGLRALRSFIYILPKMIHSGVTLVTAVILVPVKGLDGMAMASVLAAFLYVVSVLIANRLGGLRT